MIDVNKEYKTRSGKRVIGLDIVLHNSCGNKTTYPVKGSIVVREKPWSVVYCIWSLEGKYDVVWSKNGHDLDLIECVEENSGKED